MKCPKKDILLPSMSYGNNFQKEFEYDAQLPEFLPNVNRPVRVDARTVVESVNLSDDKVEIVGKLIYGFLYASDYKDSLKYTEFEDSFLMKADFSGITPQSVVTPKLNCISISCKMLNPRKCILKSKFDLSFSVFNAKHYSVVDENAENCFFRTGTVPSFTKSPAIEKEFCFDESFSIGEDSQPIGEIIASGVNVLPTEISAGDGYLNIKANAFFRILYQSDAKEPKIFMISKSLPLSFIVEDDSIKSDSECSVEIVPVSLSSETAIDSYGENRMISLKLCVKLVASCITHTVTVLPSDVFSPNTVGNQNIVSLEFDNYIGSDKKVFTIEKLIESNDVEFTKLLDATVTLNVTSREVVGNETILEGVAVVSLLGDTAGGADLIDYQTNFTEKLPATDVKDISIKPLEISTHAISGTDISIRIVASAEYSRFARVAATAVENCDFAEKPAAANAPGLLIYYPASSDDLWTISKEYGVAPDCLRAANSDSFEGEKLRAGNIIIIPKQLA